MTNPEASTLPDAEVARTPIIPTLPPSTFSMFEKQLCRSLNGDSPIIVPENVVDSTNARVWTVDTPVNNSREIPPFIPTKAEVTFQKKHGALMEQLANALGIHTDVPLAIIERESHFREGLNSGKSLGFMQIQEILVRDVGNRPFLFVQGFANLTDEILHSLAKPLRGVFQDMRKAAQQYMAASGASAEGGKSAKKDLALAKSKIQSLNHALVWALQDDRANLVLGNIFYARAENEVPKSSEWLYESVNADAKDILNISPSYFKSMVLHGERFRTKAEKAQAEEQIMVQLREIVQELFTSGSDSLQKEYLALRMYNANNRKCPDCNGRASISHSLYYALAVLVRTRQRGVES